MHEVHTQDTKNLVDTVNLSTQSNKCRIFPMLYKYCNNYYIIHEKSVIGIFYSPSSGKINRTQWNWSF